MMKIRFIFLSMALAFFSCQSMTENIGQKVVKINLKDDPHTLDPRIARDPNSQMLMRMFFEGLTRIGPNDQPQLALAQSVEISQDLKSYTFTLRPANWSNGDSVKASDFIYAWKKILSNDFPSDNTYQLYLLKNAKNPEHLGVVAKDDQTLLVELEYPTPYFLELLAAPFFFPVNQRVDEAEPKWAFNEALYVSNGPFVLKSWRHNDLIVAQKNERYWDAENVHLDGIQMVMLDNQVEMNLFEKGKLHWAGSPLSVIPVDAVSFLKKKGDLIVKPRDETAFIRANIEILPLHHQKFRRALAMAIDRKVLVEHVTRGGQIPATGLVPPSMSLQKEPYFEDATPPLALKLFEEALADLKLTRETIPELRFLYINSERSHLLAQAIQQQWRAALGIKIKLEAIERKVFLDRISKQDFELAFCSWGADFHDPINFLEVFKYKHQSSNSTHWEDPQYAYMLNDTFGILNPEERFSHLAQCEKILIEAMPIIPLFHYSMAYLKSPYLEDVFLSSLGNLDFKWATLEKKKK